MGKLQKIKKKDMEKVCAELGKGPLSEARIYCPFCTEVPMIFSGWMGSWVDYMCPSCKFFMNFRYDFEDRGQVARVDGYHIPKEEYELTEDEFAYHLANKRHLQFLEIARKKGLMPVEVDNG